MNYLLIGLLAFVAVLGTPTSNETTTACTCGSTTPHTPTPATLDGTNAGCNGGWMEY